MPQCRLPDGRIIAVGGCPECDSLNGGCIDDSTSPFKVPVIRFCFVRNVLVRALSDALVDLGASDGITSKALESMIIGADRKVGLPDDADLGRLTPQMREDLAGRITGGILQLAETYQNTVDFRDQVLATSPRGTEFKNEYDRYLGAIYQIAARDQKFVHDASVAWLSVHSFAAAMVAVANKDSGSETSSLIFTEKDCESCLRILWRLNEAAMDDDFRNFTRELIDEVQGYSGLTASEALEKLQNSQSKT